MSKLKSLFQLVSSRVKMFWGELTEQNYVSFTGQHLVDLFEADIEEENLNKRYLLTLEEMESLANRVALGGEELEPLRHRLKTRIKGLLADVRFSDMSTSSKKQMIAGLEDILDNVCKEDIVSEVETMGDDGHMLALFLFVMEEYCIDNKLRAIIMCDREGHIQRVNIHDLDSPETDKFQQAPVIVIQNDSDEIEGLSGELD